MKLKSWKHITEAVFLSTMTIVLPEESIAITPSYDCSKARAGVETTICGNAFLADLDNQLSKAYLNVINNLEYNERDKIKRDEVSWVRSRNNCEQDYQGKESMTECIKYHYRRRFNELNDINPLPETLSHRFYREGNDEYQTGNYYSALSKYHEAYNAAGDYVERIRALGALAQISKVQGNITLAKGYAQKILDIDSTSRFAQDILAIDDTTSASVGTSSTIQSGGVDQVNVYNYSSNTRRQDRVLKCLALTWGPDVCGYAFNNYARENLNTEVNDIIASPACGATIASTLDEEFSQSDLQLAMLTGALDEAGKAGVESDNFFGKIFGGFAYIYSFAVKASIYDSCMKK
jgi:uncharacterized protein